MRKFCLLLTFLYCCHNLVLSGQIYSVALIPDSLRAHAHSVIRDFTTILELKSYNNGSKSVKKVITVLDREGELAAILHEPYDKNSSIAIRQIIIFDQNGKKIKTIKQSEIEDYPAFSSFELYSEDRIKFYRPTNPEYPYSIEYDYEKSLSNIISYGQWMPVYSYDISVQHATFILIHPLRIKVNKKESGITEKPSALHNDILTQTWEINNLSAFEDEPLDIDLREQVPSVYLMPSELIYEKHQGKANNWDEYGRWNFDLYKGRDELSDDEKIKITTLLKNIADTSGKIKALYQYMQENTRYVAITLGIGGFQPFDAKTVYQTGYGDCKALTNYMHSLLNFIGVKSYPAIVSSGAYKVLIFRDFPNFSQFDHVILCLPSVKDTLWLECTNQNIPFGFLGDFTDDRDVLLLTENGGKFAHTKKYNATDNIKVSRSEFIIDPDGAANCSMRSDYTGLQYSDIFSFLRSNYTEQKKWLYDHSELPSLQIKAFSVNEKRELIPSASITESAISKNYCSFSGKYMIIPLNLINVQKPFQKMLRPRYSDVLINDSEIDYDTVTLRIPKNYRIESIPKGGNINSGFGSYSYSIITHGDSIVYARKFEIREGRYKPSEYKDFYDFILSVSKADNVKVLMTRKI